MSPGADTPLLRQPVFRRFWVSRLASTASGQMLMVALGWQMYDLTGSAWDLGLVGLAQFVPALLLALPAGHLVDRHDRRTILAAVLLLHTAVAAVLALASVRGWLGREGLLGVSVLLGAARAFQMPASQALLPRLVPREVLPRALALASTALQGAIIAGPALGGWVYALGHRLSGSVAGAAVAGPGAAVSTAASTAASGAAWEAATGAAAVYALAMGGFGLALWAIVGLRVPPLPPEEAGAGAEGAQREPVTLATLSAGLRFIVQRKPVLGAVSLDLFAVLLGGATALLPLFARDILQAGPEALGLLRSAPAVGALGMSLALARWPLARHTGRWLFGSVAVYGFAMLAFGLSEALWLSLLALAVSGAADMVSVVVRQTLVQLETPDAMRGRVSAVNSLFIGASNQLGEFESGAVAAWLGPVASVVSGGVGTLVVVVLWWHWFPTLAQRDRLVPPPTPDQDKHQRSVA